MFTWTMAVKTERERERCLTFKEKCDFGASPDDDLIQELLSRLRDKNLCVQINK